MTHAVTFGGLLLAAIAYQGGPGRDLAVPTKITVVPADSFRGGNTVTVKASFATNKFVWDALLCQQPSFMVRLYNAKAWANDPDGPRSSADTTHQDAIKPVTPYLQQSGAPWDPLPASNEVRAERTFEPMVLPVKTLVRVPRLYIGLFRTCQFFSPEDINPDQEAIIYSTSVTGTLLGGTFFRRDCGAGGEKGGQCVYRPE